MSQKLTHWNHAYSKCIQLLGYSGSAIKVGLIRKCLWKQRQNLKMKREADLKKQSILRWSKWQAIYRCSYIRILALWLFMLKDSQVKNFGTI